MRPVTTHRSNFRLVGPAGSDIGDLPAEATTDEHGHPVVVSSWQPTPEERQAIADGAPVTLVVWTRPDEFPPVALTTTADIEHAKHDTPEDA